MLKISIPMAGKGTRFKEDGYLDPKPLIKIHGKPMIQWVVENVRPATTHEFIFIHLKDQQQDRINDILNRIEPRCKILTVDYATEGAACTVLHASDLINDGHELLIANCDQLVDLDINTFIDDARLRNLDGSILVFPSQDPKWSYAKLGADGLVKEVAEKKPISNNATTGIYYYKEGRYFVKAATQMIEKNLRVNNEFYVCPAYNEMIFHGLRVGVFRIATSSMHGLGTPEDIKKFLAR